MGKSYTLLHGGVWSNRRPSFSVWGLAGAWRLINAEFVTELFESWGYETEIEVFYVLFPTPEVRELELLQPHRFRAALTETVVEEDSAAAAFATNKNAMAQARIK